MIRGDCSHPRLRRLNWLVLGSRRQWIQWRCRIGMSRRILWRWLRVILSSHGMSAWEGIWRMDCGGEIAHTVGFSLDWLEGCLANIEYSSPIRTILIMGSTSETPFFATLTQTPRGQILKKIIVNLCY